MDEKVVSRALKDHYTLVVKPHDRDPQKFYSYRYLMDNKFLLIGSYRPTAATKKLLQICPHPRLTAFTQGKAHFPYENRHELLRMIAMDIMSRSTMLWNQIAYDVPGEGFILIVDIDSDERIVQNHDIVLIAHCLWKTLKAYYVDFETNPIDVLIAKCGPRLKKGKMSTGIHIYARVKVNIEEAHQLIYGFSLRVKAEPGLDMTGLKIDSEIYRSKSQQCSMRMIYSNKVDKCPVCKDETENRQSCTFCNHMGEVISKSTYEPLSVLDPVTGTHSVNRYAELIKNHEDMVRKFSIWPEPGDDKHEYRKPDIDPIYVPENKSKRSSAPHGDPNKKLKRVKVGDPSYASIQKFIQEIVWDDQRWWDGIEVTDILLSPGDRTATIKVDGLGSSMCPYAKKDHGGNRIYFKLTRKGALEVKCFSDKAEYGCQTKERITFEVPGRVTQEIFGLEVCPPLVTTSGAKNKNFSFAEFLRRQHESHEPVRDESTLKREKKLKELSDFYKIGGAPGGSTE